MSELKNDLLLRALRKEKVERPPVWMMRQAGRYLPDYIKLREKYDFFTRVQTPELACQITLQPVDQVGVDAAIIFSDILVVPQAMGLTVKMDEGKGPQLPGTIKTAEDIDRLVTNDVEENLGYVLDAISLTKKELNGRVPLIGFAGAPWTILCYMIEGGGSKTWDKAKAFAYTQPELAHRLLKRITKITVNYLEAQANSGVDTVQVFDSWSGSLSPADFRNFAQPYLLEIADAISKKVPVILFPRGSWYALKEIGQSSAAGIGIDWTISPQTAREMA
ncbi:MAG: uroporphyrinogen decarboxylase, partial [Chitinophagales bacterium]